MQCLRMDGQCVSTSPATTPRRRAIATQPGAAYLDESLLAVQARAHGWTIVTRDADFSALRPHVSGLQVIAPFPERA